jgi:hypothetical protein
MAKEIKINGRTVLVPDSVTLESDIRRLGNIDPARNMIRRTREGNFLVPRGSSVPINEGEHFVDVPSRVKGASEAKRIKINGRDVFIPDSANTTEEILRAGKIDSGKNLLRVNANGNFIVPKGRPVTINDGEVFIDAPARVKGAAYIWRPVCRSDFFKFLAEPFFEIRPYAKRARATLRVPERSAEATPTLDGDQ